MAVTMADIQKLRTMTGAGISLSIIFLKIVDIKITSLFYFF